MSGVDILSARVEVNTPRYTLQMAFAEYEGQVKLALEREMDRMVKDGTFVKAAVKELERQLPEFLRTKVQSMLYSVDFTPLMKPLVQAALDGMRLPDK